MFCCGVPSCCGVGQSTVTRGDDGTREGEFEVSSSRYGMFRASGGLAPQEMQALLDKMKADILSELRGELRDIAASTRESNQHVLGSVEHLASDLLDVQRDVEIIRARIELGLGGRFLGRCASTICGGDDPTVVAANAARQRKGSLRARASGGDLRAAASGKEPKLVNDAAITASPSATSLGALDSARPCLSYNHCLLWPVVERFESAIGPAGAAGEAKEVQREPFVDGLQEYATLLDKMGGSMGSYLETNIKKLRNSKADKGKQGYRDWLLSELPVHEAKGYREYVDDSAWMANLWLGWTLEFFVEFFALLSEGKETKQSADAAYRSTLYAHHNFFQRNAFMAAVGRLPKREDLLASFKGAASLRDTERDLASFVALGRPIVKFCLRTNDMLDKRLQEERKAFMKK